MTIEIGSSPNHEHNVLFSATKLIKIGIFLKIKNGVEVHDSGSVLCGKGAGIFNVQDKVAVEDYLQGGAGGKMEGILGGVGDVL